MDLTGIFVVGAIAVVAALRHTLRRHDPGVPEETSGDAPTAWYEASRRLGGAYFKPASGHCERAIRVTIHGVEVTLDTHASTEPLAPVRLHRRNPYASDPVQVGWRSTQASVEVDTEGFELHVAPEDIVSSMATAFGGQDVSLGDQEFDAYFVVRTNRPALARAWLTSAVRPALLATSAARFSVRGGLVAAIVATEVDDPTLLVALARAVAALACGGRELRSRWRAAAEALGASNGGTALSFELSSPAGLVRVAADDAQASVQISLVDTLGRKASATLDGIEPDLAVWSATIERLVEEAKSRPAAGYR